MAQLSINTDLSGGMGFVTGANNPFGLKLSIEWDGEKVTGTFTPSTYHQGWPEITHGGVISAIMDETMGYATHLKGYNCVTASLQVKFRQPSPLEKPLYITAYVTRKEKKLLRTKAEIRFADGTLVAEGTSVQYIMERQNQ